jgi:DENN (AEX-3) domain
MSQLPAWLRDGNTDSTTASSSSSNGSTSSSATAAAGARAGRQQPAPPLYCPKALLLLSHYPFYNVYSQFLQQLYRISLSEAPVPIERYISNFVCEVPLPPQGQVRQVYAIIYIYRISFTNPSCVVLLHHYMYSVLHAIVLRQ